MSATIIEGGTTGLSYELPSHLRLLPTLMGRPIANHLNPFMRFSAGNTSEIEATL